MDTSAPNNRVIIIGSGLSGMSAAFYLLQRGFRVSIYEAGVRIGGKTGANQDGADFNDHGYHIFPAWYLNVWHVVRDLGIAGNFVDCTDFSQLKAREFPQFTVLRNITSFRSFWANLTSGVGTVPEMFLFFYFSLDLASQHYRYRAFLDQISISGFLRSRFYRTERLALAQQDLILKGISVPSYIVSAMSVRNIMRFWLKYPTPMFRILKGNLQEFFMQPLRNRLAELGCEFHLAKCLSRLKLDGRALKSLYFREERSGTLEELQLDDTDKVILAIPAEKVVAIIDDDLYTAAPALANVKYIRTQPMAALNIYLKARITGLPGSHTNLVDSKFGLSLIDVSQTWKGYDGSVLNVIASDFTPLEGLSTQKAISEILAEMRRYLPGLDAANIRKLDFQPHIMEPLFMNDVGVWQFRPDSKTQISNLYLAGDYCRSHIDLLSMEGAVTTGLSAAEAVRQDARATTIPIEILVPDVHPRWLLLLMKWAILPLAVIAKFAVLMTKSE